MPLTVNWYLVPKYLLDAHFVNFVFLGFRSTTLSPCIMTTLATEPAPSTSPQGWVWLLKNQIAYSNAPNPIQAKTHPLNRFTLSPHVGNGPLKPLLQW